MSTQPEWLWEAFRLRKLQGQEARTLVCEVWRYREVWRLRVVVDGVGLETSVDVDSHDLIPARVSELRDLMHAKGWR